MEFGYHVTLVRDGTAARSPEALHAMMDIDGPTYRPRHPPVSMILRSSCHVTDRGGRKKATYACEREERSGKPRIDCVFYPIPRSLSLSPGIRISLFFIRAWLLI
jgi:hypothetical protein